MSSLFVCMKSSLLDIGSWIANAGADFLNLLVDLTIGPLLWTLCDIFFVLLDLFEGLFKRFAGISDGVTFDGEAVEGDLVLWFIKSDLVEQIFMSILVLSLFLLIIFTIVAIVKNQYSDKPKPVTEFVNSAFKALLMYLLVPVATVVCLMVGNVVLQAVDGATRATGGTSASDTLFITAAYKANKLRDNDLGRCRARLQLYITNGFVSSLEDELALLGVTDFDSAGTVDRETMDIIATMVDDAYVNEEIGVGGIGAKWFYYSVCQFYHTIQLGYLTIWIGGGFLIWAIGTITWGLISRLFKMVLFYSISPAVMATFPLDNGKALGSWRGEMVKLGTMTFVSVGVLNVLYCILPFFTGLNIFAGELSNSFVNLFINIIAFFSAKDLISSISGWFGTGDILAEGAKAKSQVAKGTGMLTGAAAGLIGAYKERKKLDGGKSFVKSSIKDKLGRLGAGVLGAYGASGVSELTGFDPTKWGKSFKDKQQAGADYYWGTMSMVSKEHKEMSELRKTMEDQVKATKGLIEALEKARQAELDSLGQGASQTQIDAVNERYDKQIDKLKSNSELVKSIYEPKRSAVESRKEELEKRKTKFSPIETLYQSIEEDEDLKKKFITMTGIDQATIQSRWDAIKAGDFSKVGKKEDWATNEKALKEAFGIYGSDILSNEQQLTRAQKAIASSYNSGNDKYLKGIFGGNIGDDGVLDLKGHKNVIKKAIEKENKEIENEATDIGNAIKQIAIDAKDTFDAIVKGGLKEFNQQVKKNK